MGRRAVIVLVAATAGLLVTGACGAGGQDGGRITAGAVARDTSAAGSARLELTLTIGNAEGIAPGLVPGTMRYSGIADFRTGQGQMGGDVPGGHVEARWIGTRSYMLSSGAAAAVPTFPGMPGLPDLTGKWLTFDTGKTGFPAASPLAPFGRPDQMLTMLRDAATGERVVGHDDVRGVATTHLRLTVDVARMTKRFASSGLTVDTKPGAPARVPADIWVDAQARLRRLVSADTGTDPSTMRLELWDYGVAVHVEAPPPADVVDLPALFSAADARATATGSPLSGTVTGPWHLAARRDIGHSSWELWLAPGTKGAVCTSFEEHGPGVPTSLSLPPDAGAIPNHNGFPAFCEPEPGPDDLGFTLALTAAPNRAPAMAALAGADVERVTFVWKHGRSDVVTPAGPDRVVIWTGASRDLDHIVVTGAHGSVTCPAGDGGGPPMCPPQP